MPNPSEPNKRTFLPSHCWINKDILKQFKKWKMPYYFMDFETIQQGVPIIKNTKPFEQVPFQWSVHKLSEKGKALEEFSFIDFDDQDIEFNFLKKLIETLGDKGTIFVHNHPFTRFTYQKHLGSIIIKFNTPRICFLTTDIKACSISIYVIESCS